MPDFGRSYGPSHFKVPELILRDEKALCSRTVSFLETVPFVNQVPPKSGNMTSTVFFFFLLFFRVPFQNQRILMMKKKNKISNSAPFANEMGASSLIEEKGEEDTERREMSFVFQDICPPLELGRNRDNKEKIYMTNIGVTSMNCAHDDPKTFCCWA